MYPVIWVVKTSSPAVSPSTPKPSPTIEVPSSSPSTAFMCNQIHWAWIGINRSEAVKKREKMGLALR